MPNTIQLDSAVSFSDSSGHHRPLKWNSYLAVLLIGLMTMASILFAQEKQGEIEGEPEEYNTQIFIAEPDGSGMKLLTKMPDYGNQGSSEWSRDGKRIAFDVWRPKFGETGVKEAKIAFVNSDGSDPQVLGDGAMPSLSPRGNRIAYSRVGRGVWWQTITPEPGEPELLDARGWGTAWSPDGTRIAYARFSPANLIIYDVIEGTRQSLFSDENGPYLEIQWNFTWSPDSQRIAFKGIRLDGTSVLAIVDARGAEFGVTNRYVGEILPTIAWRPDGKQILFSKNSIDRDNPRQIFALDPEANDPPRILVQQPENRWTQDMSFSPDGTKLTFSAYMPFRANGNP